MGFKDVFKKSFLEGFTSMDITTGKIAATLIVTALLALYIFAIYRLVTRKVFYSKNFNISLAVMSNPKSCSKHFTISSTSYPNSVSSAIILCPSK